VDDTSGKSRTRRALLVGGIGAAAAVVAEAVGRPMEAVAATGDPIKAGKATSAGTRGTTLTATTSAPVLQVTQSGSGRAVRAQVVAGAAFEGTSLAGSGTGRGLLGVSNSITGDGVAGYNDAGSGDEAYGVYGETASPDGDGVHGYAASDRGAGAGVHGTAKGPDGDGVFGHALSATGNAWGVFGTSDSADGAGVGGVATATSGVAVGVTGSTKSPDGWAGSFTTEKGGGVYVSAPAGKAGLNVAGGTKNAVVATSDGARLMYAEEAAEVWFADYGFGRLAAGSATVAIDPTFAEVVDLGIPYHVFVQGYGAATLAVTQREADRFVVRSSDRLDGAEFSYRIVAKRRGYGTARLERAAWADGDANLFPDRVAAAGGPTRAMFPGARLRAAMPTKKPR